MNHRRTKEGKRQPGFYRLTDNRDDETERTEEQGKPGTMALIPEKNAQNCEKRSQRLKVEEAEKRHRLTETRRRLINDDKSC